jgi:hypothetical protein
MSDSKSDALDQTWLIPNKWVQIVKEQKTKPQDFLGLGVRETECYRISSIHEPHLSQYRMKMGDNRHAMYSLSWVRDLKAIVVLKFSSFFYCIRLFSQSQVSFHTFADAKFKFFQRIPAE